ncbi:hypothetical protein Dimus_000037 [Dionaea muscipula]
MESMDFHSLKRRDLQVLCKKNKIPANMTNLAMANALQSLDIVEGLEELLKQCETEASESPEKSEMTTRSLLRSSTRQRPKKEERDSSMTTIGTHRGSSRRIIVEETDQEKKDVSRTPAAVPSRTRRGLPMGSLQKKETETPQTKGKGVEMPVYSSRRSARLLERKIRELSLEENEVLQRKFVESLQKTEDGDGSPEKRGSSGGESMAITEELSLVSEVSQVALCQNLDGLANKEMELQDNTLEKKAGGQEVNIGFEVDDSNLSLEEAHCVSDTVNGHGAEDATNKEIESKSKLFVREESDSRELFSLLNKILKLKEDSNSNVEEGQDVSVVTNCNGTEDVNIEVESNREEMLHDSKEQLDVLNEAISGKVNEACDGLNDDLKEEHKGLDDTIEGSTISVLINGVAVNQKDYEFPRSSESSIGGACSMKLEGGDGVKAEDENSQKDVFDISLTVVKAVCENQPCCGVQKSDVVEENSTFDVSEDIDVEDSAHGGIFNEVEEDENGVKAHENKDPQEADCVSVVSEDLSMECNLEQDSFNVDSMCIAQEGGSTICGAKLAIEEVVGSDGQENHIGHEGSDQEISADIKRGSYDGKELQSGSLVAIVEYSTAELTENAAGFDALPSPGKSNKPLASEEEQEAAGKVDTIVNVTELLCLASKVHDAYSQDERRGFSMKAMEEFDDQQEDLDQLVSETAVGNKENTVDDDLVPGGAINIPTAESGTPLEAKSVRWLKKEIKKLAEKKRQALKPVSDNCLTAAGERAQEN